VRDQPSGKRQPGSPSLRLSRARTKRPLTTKLPARLASQPRSRSAGARRDALKPIGHTGGILVLRRSGSDLVISHDDMVDARAPTAERLVAPPGSWAKMTRSVWPPMRTSR